MPIIDRIKFDSPSDDVLVWKYPSQELRLGSQLIVHPTQEAVFVKGGQAFDIFTNGTHTLSSGNLPLLGKAVNIPFGNQTPFPAEIWFVSKTVKRDLKWGTKTPIPLIDPEYNFPISVRAYGRWGIRIMDSRIFVTQIVGTLASAESTKVWEYFTGEIHQRFSDIIATMFSAKKTSIFAVNTQLNELSEASKSDIAPVLGEFGIELINFNVERVSIPETEIAKFQAVMGRRMEIDQISKAQVGNAYTTMRTFDTLEKAASNQGGGAGALLAGGLGLGVGVGAAVPLGKQVGEMLDVKPSPDTNNKASTFNRLQDLKRMLDAQLISDEEYSAKKRSILDEL